LKVISFTSAKDGGFPIFDDGVKNQSGNRYTKGYIAIKWYLVDFRTNSIFLPVTNGLFNFK
jgi:hypothetical protein